MKQVLLVIETEVFGQEIRKTLCKEFDVLLCRDAKTADDLMALKPAGLILQNDLPGTDGITFLENLLWKPAVILSIGEIYTPYSFQRLRDLGVGFFFRTPCSVRAVADRFRDMMKEHEKEWNDDQKITAGHLQKLGIPSIDGGGKQLRVAIPLFAQDPRQKLSGELYPVVASICGSTATAVERKMGRTIQMAWSKRDRDAWEEYFPSRKRTPTNRVFLSALAKKLY